MSGIDEPEIVAAELRAMGWKVTPPPVEASAEPLELFHFTSERNAALIDAEGGWVQPANVLLAREWQDPRTETGKYVWMISEPSPVARLVGFHDDSEYLAVRFRVVTPTARAIVPWMFRRGQHTREWVDLLESHAMPRLWWVSDQPVRVERG